MIFKYRPLGPLLLEELSSPHIYCSSPKNLNDPLDCQIDAVEAIDRILPAVADENRRDALLHFRAEFSRKPIGEVEQGVCCFTLDALNPLMWAHYASQWTGVCVGYDFDDEFFAEYHHAKNPAMFVVGQCNVRYDDNPFSSWLATGDLNTPTTDPMVNACASLISGKGACWGYEEECRLLFSKPGRVAISPKIIKQVAFGLRTPDNAKKEIIASLRKSGSAASIGEVTRRSDIDCGYALIDLDDNLNRKS